MMIVLADGVARSFTILRVTGGDWLKCRRCHIWMHESCAENSGVIGTMMRVPVDNVVTNLLIDEC